LGLVLVVTAFFSYSPLYTLLGINTRHKRREGGAPIDGQGESKVEFRLEKTSLAPPSRFGARDAVGWLAFRVRARGAAAEAERAPPFALPRPDQCWTRRFSLVK
jgi:hypothetical protein